MLSVSLTLKVSLLQKAERAEAMAADESRQRAEDAEARKAAQAAAQAATEVAGEEWKAAEQAKRERKLAEAKAKLAKMRGDPRFPGAGAPASGGAPGPE